MDERLLFLFSFLDEVEKEIADDAEKQVWIEIRLPQSHWL